MDSDQVVQLLTEIRDIQRAHLKEYCRVTQESLELSRLAVQRQEQFGRLYRRVLAATALFAVVLIVLLAWSMGLLR